MDKRIHTKKTTDLTYRHYLSHFKWPLLGLIVVFIFISFIPTNLTSFSFLSAEEQHPLQIVFTDVIYPIDFSSKEIYNTSILYYLSRKNQLKSTDDDESINKKQKVILPLTNSESSSNSYLILEFTRVFKRPRFCSATKEQIFGTKCPYTNW
jgi:hypothetical protein